MRFGCEGRCLFLAGAILLGAGGFLLALLGLVVGWFGFGTGGCWGLGCVVVQPGRARLYGG
jgi:hypothetical protein